ncbi:hypothetical protein PIB30_034746 [Stylosanthes scabra]|uniref:Uncharacterized protein n=1 Tax=Stylosanthes scabra TaxID=79078 RepID=A0ABU6YDJ7_9FABA|nr:hypothetical protein [Stylosanthes scabra]
MDQPLIIRLHPNVVIHERQDGVWFQSDSSVVFQHQEMSTMSELVAVFLHHLRGRFTAIRKVGLMPQHVMDFLVEVGGSIYGPPVAATSVRAVGPSLPETEMAVDNSESDSEYSTSTGSSCSDGAEGDDCVPETTTGAGCSRYVLPAPPPIPRLDDVPCFFQQLDRVMIP